MAAEKQNRESSPYFENFSIGKKFMGLFFTMSVPWFLLILGANVHREVQVATASGITDENLWAHLVPSLGVFTFILLVIFLGSYFLFKEWEKIITGPLMDLLATTKEIRKKRDYSLRGKIWAKDEVGELAEMLNALLKQIQMRDFALQKAYDDLERRISDREKILTSLEKSNDQLKNFLHVSSHDLKSTLNDLMHISQWLLEDHKEQLSHAGTEKLELLHNRVLRMRNFIQGVLHYSRINRTESTYSHISTQQIVEQLIKDVSKPEGITVTMDTELPDIEGHPLLIPQVFQNLIENAIKYMDKPNGEIRIGCGEHEGDWAFFVKDNGPGIEKKYFERIFKVFETINNRDDVESTGIGLSLVKKVIEQYGGKVWVESIPSQGSVFWFTVSKNSPAQRSAA